MKAKKTISKIICALLAVVMLATAVPVMSFAADAGTTPYKVSLANAAKGVKVSYQKVDGATNYTVYRRTADTDWTVVASFKPKTYYYVTDSTAVSGTEYYYSVGYTTPEGTFTNDPVGQKILYVATPSYTIENAGSCVLVTINQVNGADKYHVLRKDSENPTYAEIGTTAADANADTVAYYDYSAENGKTYTYCVRASMEGTLSYLESKSIETFLVPLPTLANVQDGVKVTYTKDPDAIAYTLYRRTDDSDWIVINTIKPRSYFYFVDKTTVSGTYYYYSVGITTADNATGHDVFGQKILYLEVPTLSLSTDGSSVTIDFTATPGADKYQVMRKLPSASSYKSIGWVSADDALTFTDTNVAEGDSYTYCVRAFSNDGYNSYLCGKKIDVAVFSADDAAFDLGEEIKISLDDFDGAEEVIAPAADTEAAEDTAAAADEAEFAFDFDSIIELITNFINGLDVEEGSVLATVIDVVNKVIEVVTNIYNTIISIA